MGSPTPFHRPNTGLLGQGIIRLHDVGSAFEGRLEVEGAAVYTERSALIDGTAAIQTPLPPGYLSYLHRMGLGAEECWSLPATRENEPIDLLDALSPRQTGRIKELVEAGHRMEFFLPVANDRNWVESLGFDYAETVWGPPPDVAAQANDKAWIRRNVLDVDAYFPEHVITNIRNGKAIYAAARRLIAKYGGAVLKHPNLASGDGMTFLHRREHWENKLRAALRTLRARPYDGEVIIEAGIFDHVPLSGQMVINDNGPEFLCVTLQSITDDTVHSGNLITSGALPGVPVWVSNLIERQSLEIGRRFHARGYRGYKGLDFMWEGSSVYWIEANGRVTGAMYPYIVAKQIEANGMSEWAIKAYIVHPGRPYDYQQLVRVLRANGMLFDGRIGVLLAAPSLLAFNKAMVYCVGADSAAALGYLSEVRSLLAPTD